jgi:trk system potassium uptake protein TrkA
MFIIINGGGKVGSYLARTLVGKGHSVSMIEKRDAVVDKLAEELKTSALIIVGDGCDVKFQEEAGVSHADVFCSVTGDDDDNLIACQLAKVHFGVKRAVARVNSPKNEHIFNAMGIEAISSTSVISRLVEEEVTISDIIRLHTLQKGQLALVEFDLPVDRCTVCHRPLSQIEFPEDTVLVTIMRDEQVIVPKGSTMIEPGDRVIAVCANGREEELRRLLMGE